MFMKDRGKKLLIIWMFSLSLTRPQVLPAMCFIIIMISPLDAAENTKKNDNAEKHIKQNSLTN
jgi:hypothetical protein